MRRRPYRRIALLAFVFTLALFPQGVRPAVATPRVTGVTVANDVLLERPTRSAGALSREGGAPPGEAAMAAAEGLGSVGEPTLLYTSPTIAAGQLFDRVGLRWVAAAATEDSVFPEYRTSADGLVWSEWTAMEHAHDLEDLDTGMHYVNPQPAVAGARYAQYRFWLAGVGGDALEKVGITFIDVNDLNLGPVARFVNDIKGAVVDIGRSYADAAPVGASRILTRADWGADESKMKWTPRYTKPHAKAVIHHTVTADGGTNVAAELRSIYYFHGVTRGWGDIGYQYLVDKFGNIWIGRQGGDHVVGGHAYGWNDGAFGVAAIGDYTRTPPTGAMQGAIANIIAMKFAQYGVQPFGADMFTHQERRSDGTWFDVTSPWPNIQGHRDANYVAGQSGGQTACPGNTIATMMEGLRRLTQNAVLNGYTFLPRIDPALPRGTFPGSAFNVATTVTNRGTTPIPAGTRVSYQLLAGATGRVVNGQGGAATIAAPIAPGASAVVTVPFVGPSKGEYLVRWDLQSGSAWWNQVYASPARDVWLRSLDWDADWISDNIPSSFRAGEIKVVTATLLNNGGRAWPATGTNPVRLTYKWTSVATGNVFPGTTKMPLPYDVQSGQSVSVAIPVTAPLYPTNYTLRLDLEKENEFSFGDRGITPDDTSIAVLTDYRARYDVGTLPAFEAGKTATVPITITNTGRGVLQTTTANPVTLGYHWYDVSGRLVVYDGARTKLGADLQPGASVQLQATVQAPSVGGAFTLRFDLVHEGVAWFSAKGAATGDRAVTVAGPVVRTFGVVYEPQVTALAYTGSLSGVPLVVRNNSNFTWPTSGANPIRLSYHWWSLTLNRTVLWEGQRAALPNDVAPGESVHVNAQVRFPSEPGTYLLRWDLVEEGVAWFSGRGVPTGDQFVRVEIQRPFVYGASMVPTVPASLPLGGTRSVPVRVQNLGATTWDSQVNLSYHWLDQAGRAVVWDGVRTPLAGIAPNAVRDLSAKISMPAASGTYTLRWDIVREGVAWFSGEGVLMPQSSVRVEMAAHGATYAPQLPTLVAARGAIVALPVVVTNTGAMTWQPGTVNLAYHLYGASGAVVVWDGQRTPLQAPVATSGTATFAAAVRAPLTPGTYTIRLDLVHEGVTWFSAQDVPTGSVTLTVQ